MMNCRLVQGGIPSSPEGSGDRLHQTKRPWVQEKWLQQIVNEGPCWQGEVGHQQILSGSLAVAEVLVSTRGKAKRKRWHVKWPRRQTWRKQRDSSWCFSFQPRASCSPPSPRWTRTHSETTEAFLSEGSQTFSLFQQWNHLAAGGVIFPCADLSKAERRTASAETLTLPLWLLSDETEPSLFLASRLSSLCVLPSGVWLSC